MNLESIQTAAGELIRIQQNIKANGVLDQNDQMLYANNLEKLGISAQNLAHIQMAGGGGGSDDGTDDLRLLFDGKIGNRIHSIKGNKHDADDDVGEETYIEPIVYDDTVEIGQPIKEEASIAEAKPVGKTIFLLIYYNFFNMKYIFIIKILVYSSCSCWKRWCCCIKTSCYSNCWSWRIGCFTTNGYSFS